MIGYVYAVAAGDLVKIGWSSRPRRRIAKIASDNGISCKLIGVVPATKEQEAELLNLLSPYRVRGEWFPANVAPIKTCRELAREVGISPAHLSRIMHGHRGISLPMAVKLKELTGIDYADIAAMQKAALQ